MVPELDELPPFLALFVEGLPHHVRRRLRGIVEKALPLLIANNGAYCLFPVGEALQVVSGNLVFPFYHRRILPFGVLSPFGQTFSSEPDPLDCGEESTLPIAFGQGILQSVFSLPHFPGQKMTWIIHPRNLLAALAEITILLFYFNESGKSPF
jgi:hypothetical protein